MSLQPLAGMQERWIEIHASGETNLDTPVSKLFRLNMP